jgi:hypothetical protein
MPRHALLLQSAAARRCRARGSTCRPAAASPAARVT